MRTLFDQLPAIMPTALTGSVVRTEGLMAAVAGFPAPIGALVEIDRQAGGPIEGEVVGFRDELTLIYPFSQVSGVRRGNRVHLRRTSRFLRVGDPLLGRVIDARGRTTDGAPEPVLAGRVPFDRSGPAAIDRPPIDTPLSTGVRAIDGLLTCGRGQRLGIFAGSGVGKSVLLGMMARYTSADVNVIALIGERGREVNEFLERDLGAEGLRAQRGGGVDQRRAGAGSRAGRHDGHRRCGTFSRSRKRRPVADGFAHAIRARAARDRSGRWRTTHDAGLSALGIRDDSQLAERTGRTRRGSITAFYSVLVEGDDPNEPICDTVRGVLDGHFWLSRKIASRGHYPAIDVLPSISRLMTAIAPREHLQAATAVRELMAAYHDHEDLISIGAYRRGSNPKVNAAIALQDEINRFLREEVGEAATIESAREALVKLAGRAVTTARTTTNTAANG